MNENIELAIKTLGSQVKVANACGVSQNAVSKWLNGSSKVSLEHALKLEKVTNGKVRAEDFDLSYADLLSRT